MTSTSLPSNLQPGGGGFLTISTTQFQDAIQGRTYRLTLNTTGGSGALSGCSVVSGTLPAGLVWNTSGSTCILSTPLVAGVPTGAVTAAPGSYPIVVQATDTSSPPKTDQLPYTITVRPEFSITQALLSDTVQGRNYGTGSGCTGGACVQAVTTSLAATAPPTVGASSQGNGPIATSGCLVSIPNNPGLVVSVAPTANQCKLASTAPLASVGTYAITFTVTDSPIMSGTNVVVPANTITKTLNLNVNSPISFSANFDNYSPTPTGAGIAAQVPDAVQNRTHGAIGPYGTATAGGKTSLIFTANGGLLTTAGLSFTPPAASSLPTPVQCAPATGATYPQVSATAATMVCNSNGAPVTASPGSYSFGVTVADAGNVATPAGSASTDALGHSSHTLTVDPSLSITLAQLGNSTPTNPTNLLDAVTGRTYGATTGIPTYTAMGGLGQSSSLGTVGNSYYQWCISTGALPTGFNSGAGNLNTPCTTPAQMPSATLAAPSGISQPVASATAFPFTAQLNDTGNAMTPGATITNSTSLTVHPVLVAMVTQTGNATPATKLLDGAVNRSYGVINGGNGAPIYAASGGLAASGSYLWCIPSGGTLPPGLSGISTTCGPTTSTAASSAKLTASPIGGTGGSFSYKVQADDGGNAAVPSTFQIPASDSMVGPTSLTIHPQIAVGLNFSPPPDAVNGRTYGSPARTDLIYTVPTGEGLAPITMTGTGFPAPIVCPSTNGTQQLNCNSASGLVTGATGAGTIIASDTANAATPAATLATDPSSQRTSDTVNVRTALALTPPAGSLATAVVGRSWGQGNVCAPSGTSACASAVYGVANGLGGYTTGPVTAGPLSCGFTSTGTLSGNYTCSTANEASAPPNAIVALTVSDTANATTPTGNASDNSETLPIVAALQITPPASVPVAVTGRSYGSAASGCSGGACTTLNYGIANGLGNYPATATMTTGAGTFSCPLSGATYQCSSTSINGAGGTAPGLNLSVSETGNGSTPGGAATDNSKTLTINAEMTVTAPTVPTAVHGRAYGTGTGCTGTGGNCAPLQYSLSNGLGNYTATGGSLTTPSDTFTLAFASPAFSFSKSAINGAGGTNPTLTFTAAETGNAATPGNTVTDTSRTLATNTELSVTPPATVATAVHGRAFGTGTGCTGTGGNCAPLAYTLSNGLGNYSLAGTSLTTPADTFVCALAAPTFSCSKTAIAGAGGSTPTLTFTGAETGNASTPGNSVTDTSKALTTNVEMSFTATPTSPFAAAVNARTYGVGSTCGAGSSACAPLTYTVQTGSGLGGYSFAFSPSINFTCTAGGTSTNCTSASVGAAGTYATAHASVTDAANASTPSNTIASLNGSLTVSPEMAVTPPASVPTAVHGRAYGTGTGCSGPGTNCAPLNYSLSNGLGNYTATGSSLTTPSDAFACTLASPTYSCTSGAIAGAGGTNPTLTFTGAETGNAATPGNSVTNTSKTLITNSEMTITSPSTVLPAVVGRRYGTGAGCSGGNCTPLAYTVPPTTPGLGTYTFTPNNFPAGFTCPTNTNTGNCQAASVGGSAG
ncbi:MAG: hypothetical protein P4N24_03215, partial [Acidobacteriota bacterium]|nr:hypothetical protein [Acidobacteriota bacterium]